MGQEGKNVRELSDNDRKNLNDIFNPYTDDKKSTDEFKKAAWRGYTIEKEVPKGSLLFISMNPSYPYTENEENDPWKNAVSYFGEEEENIDDKLKATNPFFKQIRKFYNELKENSNILPPLAHHDLLFIRETNQNNVKKWMGNKIRKKGEDNKFKWVEREGEEKVGNFFTEQLDLSKKIIVESNPRLIVVLNAGARVIFNDLFRSNNDNYPGPDPDEDNNYPPFCEELGAYIYTINKKEVPVLFSGMLSGQRALDLGSKRSLRWHIKEILKKLNSQNL